MVTRERDRLSGDLAEQKKLALMDLADLRAQHKSITDEVRSKHKAAVEETKQAAKEATKAAQ